MYICLVRGDRLSSRSGIDDHASEVCSQNIKGRYCDAAAIGQLSATRAPQAQPGTEQCKNGEDHSPNESLGKLFHWRQNMAVNSIVMEKQCEKSHHE